MQRRNPPGSFVWILIGSTLQLIGLGVNVIQISNGLTGSRGLGIGLGLCLVGLMVSGIGIDRAAGVETFDEGRTIHSGSAVTKSMIAMTLGMMLGFAAGLMFQLSAPGQKVTSMVPNLLLLGGCVAALLAPFWARPQS